MLGIRALGGDVRVNSVVSEWTEFTVDFPHKEPPACMADMQTTFRKADVYTVGQDEHLSEIFDFFHVNSHEVATMVELEHVMQQTTPASEKRARIFVAKSSLFQKDVAHRLTEEYGLKGVIVGLENTKANDLKSYKSLGEIVPSTFMDDLVDLVNQSLNLAEHKTNITGCVTKLPAPCDLNKLRILCAEDNLVNQKILVRMLNNIGVTHIDVVSNGKLAVEKEAVQEFDIVLSKYIDCVWPVLLFLIHGDP